MKILYLTDQTYLHGGIEKVLSQKANYFADEMDDDVTIVTYNQQGNIPCYSFSSKIHFLDLGVDYMSGKSYFHPYNLKKIPKHRKLLKKILNELKPEVLISCSFGPDFYFLPFIEKSIPKIKEFHSSRFFSKQNRAGMATQMKQRLGSWIEKQFDSIVILNVSEVDFYNNKNISIIPNPAEISGERADLTKKRILAAGRIAPVKNFGDLIEIFFIIHEEFKDWELHLFGEDYNGTLQALKEKVESYKLENHIKFKGVTRDLKNEMRKYSIYAMTSETECFPMVLLESLSVGLPIISYDSPTGPKHIVTDKVDGFLVPYKNLPIFAEQLKKMMRDEKLRHEFSINCLQSVQRFRIELIMKRWKNLFADLIK